MSKKKNNKTQNSLTPSGTLPPLEHVEQQQTQQEEMIIKNSNEGCFIWETYFHKKIPEKNISRYT